MKLTLTFPEIVEKIIVAYSGGLDSHCLLHYLAHHDDYKNRLHAVYINHQLSPNALAWQAHCEVVCAQYHIPFTAYSIDIQRQAGESLEAVARTARYKVFTNLMDAHSVLITAHHQDDQAETMLLHLLRGSGIAGLAAMPALKSFAAGYHLRPLLKTTRQELLEYAQEQQLVWIEDESNQSLDYDRNYLRHEIFPRLSNRWRATSKTIARGAEHASEALTILEEVAAQDYAHTCVNQYLSIAKVQTLSKIRQKNLLRYWLKKQGLTMPSTDYLERIITEVMLAKADAQPCVEWQGGIVRRYQQHLYAFVHMPQMETGEYHWNWQAGGLALKNSDLTLCLDPDAPNGLDKQKLPEILQVKFRQGGEEFKLYPRQHHHDVKKLMQNWAIAPWERENIPFIYAENTLIALGGYGYNTDYVTDEAKMILRMNYEKLF